MDVTHSDNCGKTCNVNDTTPKTDEAVLIEKSGRDSTETDHWEIGSLM